MKCPVDGATLVMSERQNIEIDYCPECRGVWLDRGSSTRSSSGPTRPRRPHPPLRRHLRPPPRRRNPSRSTSSRPRSSTSGTGATTPTSTRRSVGAARRRKRRTSSASCSTTDPQVISRRLALGLLAGGVARRVLGRRLGRGRPHDVAGRPAGQDGALRRRRDAGGRPLAAPSAAHRAGRGGGAHPRRLLAAPLRPDADGAARPGRGRAWLGGLEPRLPGLGQRRRRLAGHVRGRGRGHRRARPGGRPPAPRPRPGGHRGPLGRRVPLAVGGGPGRPARGCARCRSGGRAAAGGLPGRGEQPGGRRVREARERGGRGADGRAAEGGG